MLILRILILIFISRVSSMEFAMKKSDSNYGPFAIKWYNYHSPCHGQQSKNVTLTTSRLETDEYSAVVYYNTTFIAPVQIKELKVMVWNVNGTQKNVLWSYKLKKPCQHFALAELLQQYFRSSRNCTVNPGEYVYSTNYTEVAYKFLGQSFFYGDYSFKAVVVAKQGNIILCQVVNALFSKKIVTP